VADDANKRGGYPSVVPSASVPDAPEMQPFLMEGNTGSGFGLAEIKITERTTVMSAEQLRGQIELSNTAEPAEPERWVNSDLLKMAQSLTRQAKAIGDEEDGANIRRAYLHRAVARLHEAYSELVLLELHGPRVRSR